MHDAQIEQRLGVTALGGRLVQLRGGGPAPIDAPAVPVAVPQLQQRIHVALSGSSAPSAHSAAGALPGAQVHEAAENVCSMDGWLRDRR